VHAVLCAAPYIDRPFAVINSDDYYGKEAFRKMYDGLKALPVCSGANMVGYRLKNTVSQYGAVTRGICQGKVGKLHQITETYNICVFPDGTIRDTGSSSDGEILNPEALVSMNFWGFTRLEAVTDVKYAMQDFYQHSAFLQISRYPDQAVRDRARRALRRAIHRPAFCSHQFR